MPLDSDNTNIISKENDKVVLDREEFEALLETFNNLQVATTRAASRLRSLQPAPARVPSTVTSAPVERVSSWRERKSRLGQRSSLEGNGARSQWGLNKRDIVRIENDVRIGSYTLEDHEKEGPVAYFTDRFVVVDITYSTDKYKLVKRERHNVTLIRRTIE